MKRTLTTLLGTTALLLTLAASSWALPTYPVQVGSTVKMLAEDNINNPYDGHYQAVNSAGYKFGVFCLEMNEYFNPGSSYRVDSIEDYAARKDPSGKTKSINDYLRGATKWLYYHFMLEDILAKTGIEENDYSLQLAIWYLEDEIKLSSLDAAANIYVTKALEAETRNEFTGDVKVMNLMDGNCFKQSQLIGAAPVPEPSTFILLGIGLLGAGLVRRKFGK